MKAPHDKRGRRRTGAHLVEIAFVFVVFWTLLMAIFQYGWVLFLRQMAQDAVREAARAAAAGNSDSTGFNYLTDSDIKTTAFNLMSALSLQNTSGAAFSSSDVIVNHVNAADMTVIGGNNDGSWIGAIPPYSRTSTVSDAVAVKIDARYIPFFQVLYFTSVKIPIQAISVARTEGN